MRAAKVGSARAELGSAEAGSSEGQEQGLTERQREFR